MTRSIGTAPASAPTSRPTWTCRPRGRRHCTDARQVAALPRASIETCAPPPVTLRTTALGSPARASTTDSAPSRRASSSAAADTSTATTRAPRAAAIIVAASPTPPHPKIATHSPGATRPCAVTARYAVANRQPRPAAVTKSSASGSGTTLKSARGTATNSANEPQPVKPGWYWSSHPWGAPARQVAHRPHAQTNGTVTRSPTVTRRTDAPTSATTPANSCPGTCGSAIVGSWPTQPCQSLRQRPVARTATTTPSLGHDGAGTSSTAGAAPKDETTSARTSARQSGHDLGAGQLGERGRRQRDLRAAQAAADHDVVARQDGGIDQDRPRARQADRRDAAEFHAGEDHCVLHRREGRLPRVQPAPHQTVHVGAGRREHHARRIPGRVAAAAGDDDTVGRVGHLHPVLLAEGGGVGEIGVDRRGAHI